MPDSQTGEKPKNDQDPGNCRKTLGGARHLRALTPVAGKFEKHDDHFENDRYVVTSAVGHLVEIQAPEQFDVKRGKWSFAHLPVIPPYFDLKPVDKTKSRLKRGGQAGQAQGRDRTHQRL